MSQKIFYPLTSPQLSIWYTEQMFPGTSISNVAGTLRLKENVDFGLLEEAINLYIKNNDSLRLRICLNESGEPQQYVSEFKYKHIEILDFSKCSNPIRELYEWNSRETVKTFEMIDQDLFRFVFVNLSDTDKGIYANFHHIISDAWSISVSFSIIIRFYLMLRDNGHLSISDISPFPSYLEFIKSENEYKHSSRYEKARLFWENTFTTIPDPTVLKTRKNNNYSTKSKRKTFILPRKFIQKLRLYCSESKATPYVLFISALAMYINRITKKEDIIIGTPLLNRINHIEKNTVGMFINTLPLRIFVSNEITFHDFSQNILNLCTSIFRHQRYPYDKILRGLREKFDMQDNLYDIVISYQNTKFEKIGDIQYSSRWHFNGHQTNSLSIHINDRDDEGTIIFDYDYHENFYFDKEIEFLHQHLLNLLWHALDNPQKTIYKIEMLSEVEKRKILSEFNNTEVEYPKKLIHELFQEQVQRTPENIAIIFDNKAITYDELNKKANQVAYVLCKKGARKDKIIGIMLPNSLELIISIIAILKSGGAFLLIDPDYAEERIKYMIGESKISILLTTKVLANHLNNNIEIVDISNESTYKHECTNNLDIINISNDLVYVIYTSGTTGLPKGVMIEHRSLHNFINSMLKRFLYNSDAVVLSVASVCFDLFIMEVFPSLLSGAKLILASKEQQYMPALISDLIIKNCINVILFTPSRMKLILQDESISNCLENVKYIILGGEKLELPLLNKIRGLTSAKIVNAYGPTEATIASTFLEIEHSDKITIGKPIENAKIFILDKNMNLLPIGVAGEIYIAGQGIARGYVNKPELTQQVFISSVYGRLYKTGDLGRWYSNGEIEYLGREDKQVKLRGYRIELSEIECVMLKYDGIVDAVVIIKSNEKYGDFLCAYYVSKTEIHTPELKSYLRNFLPQYMIPKFFIPINFIPINNSGKKDLGKLPDIDTIQQSHISALPLTDMQKRLETIICKILGVDIFSVDEDIFNYGADSLTVIQLVTLLNKEGYRVSTEDIYKYSTILQLERLITTRSNSYIAIESAYNDGSCSNIEKMIENGVLSKLDSAAISYLPKEILNSNDKPVLYNYIKTFMGNIGMIMLPLTKEMIFENKEKCLSLCKEAIYKAEKYGAKSISITGLLPYATNYGKDVLCPENSQIKLTTGHATTAAAIVLNLERMLSESNRNVVNETIAIIGIESIGTAVVEMLLFLYPNIKKIILFDFYHKKSSIDLIEKKLRKKSHDVTSYCSELNFLPAEVYEATLLIAATNTPDIIDINLLKPGTLVIEYSYPCCFSKKLAIKRLMDKSDILITEGGAIELPTLIEKYAYIPKDINGDILSEFDQHFNSNKEINGCILSSILITKHNELQPVTDIVDYKECLQHYNVLVRNNIKGKSLHCRDFMIPDQIIKTFRSKYGIGRS